MSLERLLPDLGFYHPIVVHFAIGLVTAGVLLRLASLARRGAGAAGSAAALTLLAAAAVLVAARSGDDAHVAVEGAPGVAAVVQAHQAWGERTRTVVVLLAGVEALALALRGRVVARPLSFACAGLGVVAVVSVLRTGELGGELVYAHAGGVGIRSGDPADVGRLLVAGLVRQAEIDEKSGRPDDAAALLDLAARRVPDEPELQVRAAEAALEDRHDPARALAILDRLGATADDGRLRFRRFWLTAGALDALGRRAEARAVLERLQVAFPDDARIRRRLARLDARTAAAEPIQGGVAGVAPDGDVAWDGRRAGAPRPGTRR